MRLKFCDKDIDDQERERILQQLKDFNSPWKTVISVVNADDERRKLIWKHVERVIENQQKVTENFKKKEAESRKKTKTLRRINKVKSLSNFSPFKRRRVVMEKGDEK